MMLWLAIALAQDVSSLRQDMLSAQQDGNLITARRLAEDVLSRRPDDADGLFVMGQVHWQSEGDHARALYFLERAYDATSAAERQSEILLDMIDITAEMGDYDRQLTLYDRYDATFEEDLGVAERGWAHMRLGDLDASRRTAEAGLESGDAWQVTLAYNTLCAVAAAAGDRPGSVEACREALQHGRSTDSDLRTDAYNAGWSEHAAGNVVEAEALMREAISWGNAISGNLALVDILAEQGRVAEAIEHLRALRRAQADLPPAERDLHRAKVDVAFAKLLLLAGDSERGLDVIGRAIRHPDRTGLFSTDELQALGSNHLLRLSLRRVALERRAEAASARGRLGQLWGWVMRQLPTPSWWSDAAAVRGALTAGVTLESTARLRLDEGLTEVPAWLTGDVIDVVGAGVFGVALSQGRAAEADDSMRTLHDALFAEVVWRGGGDASELAADAAIALPVTDTLFQARMHAIAADASGSAAHYERALQLDPGVFRRLGLSIPARVERVGVSAASRGVADALARSPRISWDYPAFVVRVGDDQICLDNAIGNQIRCATVTPADSELPLNDEVLRIVGEAHDQLFAISLGLSRTDLNSLDSTNASESDAERKVLLEMLDAAAE